MLFVYNFFQARTVISLTLWVFLYNIFIKPRISCFLKSFRLPISIKNFFYFLDSLCVIEDAAQAIDSYFKGKALGSIGHLATFSFHETKNIISGEGGMLVARDPEWAQIIPMLRHNGHRPYPVDRPDYWIPAMTDVTLPRLKGKALWPINCCLAAR